MNIIVIAVISVGAMGLVCAALLSVASKVMHVEVDESIAFIRASLPGANCGACGYSGCDGYASALVENGVAANLCPPGGDAARKQINEILGTDDSEGVDKKIAIVHCMGDSESTRSKMEYDGITTCFAAHQLYGGQGACTFGCIGFGDCMSACPSAAICVENDLARIDSRKCTGCGICVKACPAGIISVETEPVHVAVLCKNTEKGAKLKDKCSRGCIGCMKCAKECPAEAITVSDFLASIDYSKCNGCNASQEMSSSSEPQEKQYTCVEVCVKKCIIKM